MLIVFGRSKGGNMLNRISCWIVLIAALVSLGGLAAAQGTSRRKPTAPNYCNPCLFYGGDFDAVGSGEDALINDNDSSINGEVYVPFTVPKQQKWQVTGLFVNLIDGAGTVVPATVKWEIRKGVSAGQGGTLVASGRANSSLGGNLNCTPIDLLCFALVMKGIKVSLPSGRYWLAVVPQCKKASCDGQLYYLLDAEDRPPRNHFGPLEPWDDSFFTSTSFNKPFFEPTWGASGTCGLAGECDRFSAGVLGTSSKNAVE
jgi:hypothetical protein